MVGPKGSKTSRNHTYCCSQNSTTSNEQQCTLTSEASTSISSEEPSRATRSARSGPTRSCNTSWDHQQESGRDITTESNLPNTTPTRTLQPQICRRHSSHLRVTEAHDHHARRLHRSYDGTRPATSLHVSPNHLLFDIKVRKRQQGDSSRKMNIRPTEGKSKYFGQLITFKKKSRTSRV